jgi:hypothetical protein
LAAKFRKFCVIHSAELDELEAIVNFGSHSDLFILNLRAAPLDEV